MASSPGGFEVDAARCAEVAERLARDAGQVITKALGTNQDRDPDGAAGAAAPDAGFALRMCETKATSSDLVTETDRACEALISAGLREAFPSHAFIGEEETAGKPGTPLELTDRPTWMVDPVDGTTNFVHGFPFVCVSIGLVCAKEPILGVVYNPVLDEMFKAIQGRGATLNGRPIRVSPTADLQSALIATEIGINRDEGSMRTAFSRIKALTSQSRSVRMSGSCACNMTSVACGRLDAFYEYGFGGPWDVAAAACILKEAGGEVLDPSGGKFDVMARRVLASNGRLGAQVTQVLAPAAESRD